MINFLKNRGFNWEICVTTYEKISQEFNNKDGENEN